MIDGMSIFVRGQGHDCSTDCSGNYIFHHLRDIKKHVSPRVPKVFADRRLQTFRPDVTSPGGAHITGFDLSRIFYIATGIFRTEWETVLKKRL